MGPWWGDGWVMAVAVLVAATLVGVFWRRRDGRLRPTADHRSTPGALPAGDPAGSAVTLLQFSSPRCGPCRQVRVLCAALAADTPGVRHVELDAERHLDMVRRFQVWRVPTLLLLDGAGRAAWRVTGVPARPALRAAVAAVLDRQAA